jgi:hypothetical protein
MSRYRILSCYHTESSHVGTESYPVTIQSHVMLQNPILLPYRVMACCYRILSYYHTQSCHVVTESYPITIQSQVMSLPNPILLSYSHVIWLPIPTLSPYVYISVVSISNPELTITLSVYAFPSDYFPMQH